MILDQVLEQKREEIKERKRAVPLKDLKGQVSALPPNRDFRKALAQPGLSLIAELKKASPSAGVIRNDFEPAQIAKVYEKGGAAAISVLTESNYFQGSLDYLEEVKARVSVPVLRKDFIIDEYQLYESKAHGADAILLIVAILTPGELNRLLSLAEALGLDALVEAHNREELNKVLEAGAEIIGINNRNLQNLEVDLSVTPRLSKFIPEGKVVISESGVGSAGDVDFLSQNSRLDAILVGEALMKSDDVEGKMRELLGAPCLKE